jgi:hypothetical protein
MLNVSITKADGVGGSGARGTSMLKARVTTLKARVTWYLRGHILEKRDPDSFTNFKDPNGTSNCCVGLEKPSRPYGAAQSRNSLRENFNCHHP